MEICLMIEGQEDVTWEDWLALAAACEEHGVGTMFRSDHYLSVDDRRERGSLDAWGTIAALGAVTEKLRLGTMVSPATFRHPAVLAKLAVTADHVSGGRVEVGIGAGWWEREHELYGFELPPIGPRMEALEEQMQIVRGHWGEGPLQLRRRALLGARARRAAEAGAAAAAADPRRQRRAAQPAHRRSLGRRVQHGDGDGGGDRRPAPAPRRGLREGGPRPGDPAALDDDRLAGRRRPRRTARPRLAPLASGKARATTARRSSPACARARSSAPSRRRSSSCASWRRRA